MEAKRGSVMEGLSRLPDPRRRQGKRYNLAGLVGMLLLAALYGETSLRGMWLWGCHQWERIAGPLELWGTKGPPSYGAVRELLVKIDVAAFTGVGDGKANGERRRLQRGWQVLRGSKRATQPALQVVTAAGHQFQQIWGQQAVVAGDEVEAAVALLQQMPLAERMVSLDAGLLQRPVVKTIEEKGGAYIGAVKGNHGEIYELVAEWVQLAGVEQRPPDHVQVNKDHGRIERRELWVVPAADMSRYLGFT